MCVQVPGPVLLATALVHLLCLSIRYSMREDQAKQIFQLLLKVMLSDKYIFIILD